MKFPTPLSLESGPSLKPSTESSRLLVTVTFVTFCRRRGGLGTTRSGGCCELHRWRDPSLRIVCRRYLGRNTGSSVSPQPSNKTLPHWPWPTDLDRAFERSPLYSAERTGKDRWGLSFIADSLLWTTSARERRKTRCRRW